MYRSELHGLLMQIDTRGSAGIIFGHTKFMQNAVSKANLKRAVNIPRLRVRQQFQLRVSRQHKMATGPNSHITAQEFLGQVILMISKF